MTAPRPPFSEVPVDDGSGGVPTGDDTAGDWIGWDERNIPIADDLYDRYLDEPPEELECRDQHGPHEVPGQMAAAGNKTSRPVSLSFTIVKS